MEQIDPILRLFNEFSEFKEAIKESISANERRVDIMMVHVDSMYMQSNENFQRQLDKNDEQHKEMMQAQARQMDNFNAAQTNQMKVFSMTMEHFVNASKDKIDGIIQAQKEEDIARNLSILELKKDISELQKEPIATAAEKWKSVKMIVITTFATALVMGCAIFAKDLIETTTEIKIPMEVGK